jgi:predicted dehydrogenase
MQKNLVPFLQRIPGHRIVAAVDNNLARASEVQDVTGAATCVDTIENLDLASVDAAILALPPEPSFRVTSYLVERDIDCFVEKPAGPSTSALEKLADIVGRSGRRVQVGFNLRYAEVMQRLRELSGVGQPAPSAVSIDFFGERPASPQWGVDTTMEAWIRHNGVHAFDLARWFNPAPVTRLDAYAIPRGADLFLAVIAMRHADGSLSTLRIGNHIKRFLVSVSVHTADGSQFTAPSLEQVLLELDAGTPSGTVLHRQSNLDHGWGRSGFGPELAAFLRQARWEDVDPPLAPDVGDALAASILCDLVMRELAAELVGVSG